jgi:hypothetical protein
VLALLRSAEPLIGVMRRAMVEGDFPLPAARSPRWLVAPFLVGALVSLSIGQPVRVPVRLTQMVDRDRDGFHVAPAYRPNSANQDTSCKLFFLL